MKNKKLFAAALPVIVFAVLVSSCSTISSVFLEPKFSVKSVELAGISFQGVEMIANIDVENLNSFDLPMPKIAWELFINTASFVQGEFEDAVNIKKRKTTTVPLHLSFTYEGLYSSVASIIGEKEAAYNAAVGITFPIPVVGDKTYSLEFGGNIPLIEIPKINPGEFRLAKMDFTGAELAYNFTVENPNNFSVPFPKMDWEYAAAGVPFLKSNVHTGAELAAKATSPVEVKFSVSYADLFKAVPSLINAAEAPSVLKMNSSFSIPSTEDVKDVFDVAGTLRLLKMPGVSVSGVNRKELGLLKAEYTINWELENKNDFTVDISRFNYDFRVNNTVWAQGFFSDPPVLKANSKIVLPLTVEFNTITMLTEIKELIQKGNNVSYSCVGDLSLVSDCAGVPKVEVPLNLSGNTRL